MTAPDPQYQACIERLAERRFNAIHGDRGIGSWPNASLAFKQAFRESAAADLDALLALREPKPCPTCAESKTTIVCPDCNGSVTVPGSSPLLALLARTMPEEMLQALADEDDSGHVVEFREDGWTIQHPLRERLDGSLFDCDFNITCGEMDGPPPEGHGRYTMLVTPDGEELLLVPVLPERGASDV